MNTQEAEKLMQEAIEAGKSRDYARAVSLLLRVHEEFGDTGDLSLYLGRAYHALEQYAPAIGFLRAYHRRKPASVAGMFFLGRAYYCAGYPKEALFQLKRALKGSPDSFQIKTYLAFAYFKAGRHDIALPLFTELVERKPGRGRIYQAYLNTLYVQAIRTFHRGEIAEAMEMFSFLEEQGVESVLLFLYLGMGAREQGRLHDALQYYEKALELSPGDELIRYRRAVLLQQLGRNRDAQKELEQLTGFEDGEASLDPGTADYQLAVRLYEEENYRKAAFYGLKLIKAGDRDTDIRLLVGESFRRTGDFSRAENHFRRALEIDRTCLEARYGIAMAQWQTGRFEEMLQVLRQIDHSDPGNDFAKYYTALARWKTGSDPEETIQLAEKALETNPNDPYLLTALGDLNARCGREDEAERRYLEAIAVQGDFKEALRGLVTLHEKQGEKPDVGSRLANEYEALIPLLDNPLEVMKKLLFLLHRLGEHERCARQAASVLELLPEDTRTRRVLAISLRRSGRHAEAARVYRALLQSDPYNERFIISCAYCLDKAGKSGEAARLMEHAIRAVKKPSYSLYLILGMVHYNSGQYHEAASVFREAIQHSPDGWQAYRNLGMTLRRLDQPDLAERYLAMSRERS